jgi:RNA polymerase sigma factor (sigma-70 family)
VVDAVTELVVPERGEERARARQASELDGGNSAASGGLRPHLARVNDLTRLRNALHARELDPLDVADDGELHGGSLTSRRRRPLQRMMDTAVSAIPPFERFYEQRRDEILGYLVRLLGKQAAEDAFQETFLRALRGYPKLVHGRELRAWAFTIATRVALDVRRRREPALEVPEIGTTDARPAYAELEHLAGELPETERAAVVLRYGYDLTYEDIATALGSSEDAARQAASSGVRRLRRRMT